MATKGTPKKAKAWKKATKKRATKRPSKSPPKRAAKSTKASRSKRPSKRPKAPKKTRQESKSNQATNGAAAKPKPKPPKARKRLSKAPAKGRPKRTTRPAKLRSASRKATNVAPKPAPLPRSMTVTAPVEPSRPAHEGEGVPPVSPRPSVPESASTASGSARETTGRPRDSYLEGAPRDHAEVLAGFLRVVKTAAGDIRTLIRQAIALSNQKRDRFDR